jgi:hypothetical protein
MRHNGQQGNTKTSMNDHQKHELVAVLGIFGAMPSVNTAEGMMS